MTSSSAPVVCGSASRGRRRLVGVALLSVAVGGAVIVWSMTATLPNDAAVTYFGSFVGWREAELTTAHRVMAVDDGRYFVALAADPALQRPEVFREGPHEAAYRAARPLAAWLLAVATLGHPSPAALLVLEVVFVAGAALALGVLLERRGISAWWALLLFAAPGVTRSLRGGYADLLSLGLTIAVVLAWERRRMGLAIAAAIAAVLARDTAIVVPLALAVYDVGTRRRWGDVGLIAIPAVAYAAWLCVVTVRYGAPTGSVAHRLALPGLALLRRAPDLAAGDLLATVVLLAVVASVVVFCRGADRLLVAFLTSAWLCVGPAVWDAPVHAFRLALPVLVFGAAALASAATVRASTGPSMATPCEGRSPRTETSASRAPSGRRAAP
jgi:hypothetical protein